MRGLVGGVILLELQLGAGHAEQLHLSSIAELPVAREEIS